MERITTADNNIPCPDTHVIRVSKDGSEMGPSKLCNHLSAKENQTAPVIVPIAASRPFAPSNILSDISAKDAIPTKTIEARKTRLLNSIVEAAGASWKEIRDTDDSNLAAVLRSAEEEPGRVTMEDSLLAAVQDILVLQSKLLESERKLQQVEEQQLINEESEHSAEQLADTKASDESLSKIEALQQEVQTLQAQKTKLALNNRKQKAGLATAQNTQAQLERQLTASQEDFAKLQAQVTDLRSGLQNVAVAREELKNKLRVQKDILKEARNEKDELERRLKKCEKERVQEKELLALYRELSNHTGFYKWGKRIRMLESELAAAVESSK